MAYGRGETWFWRLIGIFSLSVCTLNLMVLWKGSPNMVEKAGEVSSVHTSALIQAATKAATKNTKVTVPAPSTGKVPNYLKKPVWPGVLKVSHFFKPDDILLLGKRRNRKVNFVIGLPTVYRTKAFYLIDTLKKLINGASKEELENIVIVVFVADFDQKYRDKVRNEISTNFDPQVKAGVIQVIVAPSSFYPSLRDLPPLYGDTIDRVRWRSKQALDYSFLYYYCSDLGKYYLQLEDDVITEQGYYQKMEKYISSKSNAPWSTLEFGARGFIGMMYRGEHLLPLARFSRFYFWTMPIDWIFRVFNDIYLHGNTNANIRRPPLFKHIGTFSSLDGQIRKLEDVGQGDSVGSVKHQLKNKNNPPATLETSIKQWVDGHGVEEPYKTGFFWGKTIDAGSTITVVFKEKHKLARVAFLSGSPRIPSDALEGSDILVSTADDCATYKLLQSFHSTVDVDVKDITSTDLVKCVQLKVTKVRVDHHRRKRWLIIREIGIWTKK